MCYRSLLILLFGIILMDVNFAEAHVIIEQTNGYNDTWTNMSSACSLLGVERVGNVWENKVVVDNINDITGTGWISAHVEHQGTLRFLGCELGTVPAGTPSLEVTHDRIPECIYFCKASNISFHRNICFCSKDIIFDKSYPFCVMSYCGNDEPLFCGQSEILPGKKCMCRYQQNYTNAISTITAASCLYANVANCVLIQPQYPWQFYCGDNCAFNWNGYLMRKVFYWGTSLSDIGNQDYCVAIRKVDTTRRITLITMPCISQQTGICVKGTRISTTQKTIQTSTVRSTNTEELTSRKPFQSSSESVKHDQQTNITGLILDGMTTLQTLTGSNVDDQQSNILGPIIGGVVSFSVLVIVGGIIVGVLIKRRRRKADTRSNPPHELNIFSTSEHQQNQYINCAIEYRGGREQIHDIDTGGYESLKDRMRKSENAEYDLFDRTSEARDTMYGRLNQDGRGNASPENADINDHSRTVGQVNIDTYDSFQTGVSREDFSVDYYDHTHIGEEDYGHVEKGCSRKEQGDDIYDHSRGHGQHVNDGTYDSFQTGESLDDCSANYYDHTHIGEEDYGHLQKSGSREEQGEDIYDHSRDHGKLQ